MIRIGNVQDILRRREMIDNNKVLNRYLDSFDRDASSIRSLVIFAKDAIKFIITRGLYNDFVLFQISLRKQEKDKEENEQRINLDNYRNTINRTFNSFVIRKNIEKEKEWLDMVKKYMQ